MEIEVTLYITLYTWDNWGLDHPPDHGLPLCFLLHSSSLLHLPLKDHLFHLKRIHYLKILFSSPLQPPPQVPALPHPVGPWLSPQLLKPALLTSEIFMDFENFFQFRRTKNNFFPKCFSCRKQKLFCWNFHYTLLKTVNCTLLML